MFSLYLYKQSATVGNDDVMKERVEMLETMCKYCGDKMESYLSKCIVRSCVLYIDPLCSSIVV